MKWWKSSDDDRYYGEPATGAENNCGMKFWHQQWLHSYTVQASALYLAPSQLSVRYFLLSVVPIVSLSRAFSPTNVITCVWLVLYTMNSQSVAMFFNTHKHFFSFRKNKILISFPYNLHRTRDMHQTPVLRVALANEEWIKLAFSSIFRWTTSFSIQPDTKNVLHQAWGYDHEPVKKRYKKIK